MTTVRDFLLHPETLLSAPETSNPATPQPAWMISGTPQPQPIATTMATWNAAKAGVPNFGMLYSRRQSGVVQV